MGFGVASSVPAVFMKLDEEDLSLANWHHEKTASSHHGLALVSVSSPLPPCQFPWSGKIQIQVPRPWTSGLPKQTHIRLWELGVSGPLELGRRYPSL